LFEKLSLFFFASLNNSMRLVIINLLLLLPLFSWSQKKSVLKKVTAEFQNNHLVWSDGLIQLRESDANLKGLIQFNEKLRTLKFRLWKNSSPLINSRATM
jgi:hypothetical protein